MEKGTKLNLSVYTGKAKQGFPEAAPTESNKEPQSIKCLLKQFNTSNLSPKEQNSLRQK